MSAAKPLEQFYKDCLRFGNLKVRPMARTGTGQLPAMQARCYVNQHALAPWSLPAGCHRKPACIMVVACRLSS
eukprot:362239-Chlamydomonas_euryale.AAC.6